MTPSDSKQFEHATLVEHVSNSAERAANVNHRDTAPRSDSHVSSVQKIIAIQLRCSVRPTKRIVLNETVIIGRVENHGSIPYDVRMSRQHFSIELNEQGAFVEDRHSTNGTWINGNRITRFQLSHRDQILSGMTVFEVELIES